MTDLNPSREPLEAIVRARGIASVSVIERAGTEPLTVWTSESDHGPPFLAYSVTKIFTAALILGLCDDRQLTLDDPLAGWFPRVPHADRITIRQLLNHSSGIPDYGGNRAYHDAVRQSPSSPWSTERFAAETFKKGLAFKPGNGWGYSNSGYMLLRRIVEVVTDTAYRTLVSERIARPLELRRTFVAESIDDLAELTPAMSTVLSPEGAPRDVRSHYHPGWVSHGVVASTASDLVRFLDGLFGGKLVSPESLAQMTTLVPVPREIAKASRTLDERAQRETPSYGLGLMGNPTSPWGLVVGHNGSGPGYNVSAFHALELGGASVCAMATVEGMDAENAVFDVFDSLQANGR